MRWARLTRSAELHGDLLQPPGGLRHDRDRLIADQVTDDREFAIHVGMDDGRQSTVN
jgi:hypothetical protein